MARQSSNRHRLIGILAKHQSTFTTTWHEQIADGLIIDLEIRQRDVGIFIRSTFRDAFEELLHSQKDDAGLLSRSTAVIVSYSCILFRKKEFTHVMVCVLPHPVAPYANTVAL